MTMVLLLGENSASWLFGSMPCGKDYYIDRQNAHCTDGKLIYSTVDDPDDNLQCPTKLGVFVQNISIRERMNVHIYIRNGTTFEEKNLYNYCGDCNKVHAQYECEVYTANGPSYFFVVQQPASGVISLCTRNWDYDKTSYIILVSQAYSKEDEDRCTRVIGGEYVQTKDIYFAQSESPEYYCYQSVQAAQYYCRLSYGSVANCGTRGYYEWCPEGTICLYNSQMQVRQCGIIPTPQDGIMDGSAFEMRLKIEQFVAECALRKGEIVYVQGACRFKVGTYLSYWEMTFQYDSCYICKYIFKEQRRGERETAFMWASVGILLLSFSSLLLCLCRKSCCRRRVFRIATIAGYK